MTAQEKFEARLEELGLMEEWKEIGECGRIAVELDDKIVLLVNESEDDKFSEMVFPTLSELRKNPKFIEECKKEWYPCWGDDKFVHELACWLDGYSNKCPLFPVDVYFPASGFEISWRNFEDDNDKEEEGYQKQMTENALDIELIRKQLELDKCRIENMIRKELHRGHNLVGKFDPYPGWGSSFLCGYNIDDKTMTVEELDNGELVLTLKGEFETTRLHLTSSDFPIEVLFNIYGEMR